MAAIVGSGLDLHILSMHVGAEDKLRRAVFIA
jgi:hypothetical protein